jgi:glycosyltransferase involved in cell wall biosynthesis
MRVLQLIGSFNRGGSETQAVQLAKSLKRSQRCQVLVATLNREGSLLSEMEDFSDIPEFRLSSFYDLNFIRQLRRFVEFLKDNQIDIVHTHDFYTNFFGMIGAKIAGVTVKIASKRETGGMRSVGQERLERLAFTLADSVLVNSEAVKNYLLASKVPVEKITVVYNGIDISKFSNHQDKSIEIIRHLNLPSEDNIRFIVITANFRHKVKNQVMLLRAAKRLLEDFPNLHFIFLGEGELLQEAMRIAEELGVSKNTHFLGRCSNVPEILAIADICVLTSLHEGFPNAVLEYMAAGKPVVATNVGGVAEAVLDAKTGFLVEPNDDDTLVSRIEYLLRNPQKASEMGRSGKLIISDRFSIQAQMERVIQLYRHLLDKKSF